MEADQPNQRDGQIEQAREGEPENISADANLEADDWDTKAIGFLAARVLSDVAKARKRTEGANAVAPSVSIAQASLGGREDVASNSNRSGGAVPAVQGSKGARDPSRRQQPPDAQTKRRKPKYRSVTYSGDL